MGHSYTMSKNSRDLDLVSRHLLRLSEMVSRRLREQGYAGRTISLVVRYEDMRSVSRQKSIDTYLDDGYAIYQVAISILRQCMNDRRAVRLVGVCASNLARGMRQMELFANPHGRELLNTMDAINNKYGEFTIRRACLVDLKSSAKIHGFSGKPRGSDMHWAPKG